MIKRIGVLLLVVVLSSVIPVAAHEGVTHETREEAQAHARESVANNRKNAVCERAQLRLGRRLQQSDEIEKRYINRYQAVIDRLDNIVLRLNENDTNVDSSDIEKDIENLNEFIEEFEKDFAAYVAALRAAINTPCPTDGNTDAIRESVSKIRTTQKQVRVSAQEIREYISDDVVGHLDELNDELSNTDSQQDEQSDKEPAL